MFLTPNLEWRGNNRGCLLCKFASKVNQPSLSPIRKTYFDSRIHDEDHNPFLTEGVQIPMEMRGGN